MKILASLPNIPRVNTIPGGIDTTGQGVPPNERARRIITIRVIKIWRSGNWRILCLEGKEAKDSYTW